MLYDMEERMAIGKRIFDGEINKYEASYEYNISVYTARDYYRLYKASQPSRETKEEELVKKYKSMSKKQLVEELIKLSEEN